MPPTETDDSTDSTTDDQTWPPMDAPVPAETRIDIDADAYQRLARAYCRYADAALATGRDPAPFDVFVLNHTCGETVVTVDGEAREPRPWDREDTDA